MTIDPRLIERRKTVAEDNAKRNVSRLLKFLTGLLLAGALVWLLFSPWLSVRQVDTAGISVSSANAILVDMGVTAGTPMIRINESATEAALLADPWIGEADIAMGWPNQISVTIVERVPVAWVRTADGWSRRAIDGVALPSAETPDEQFGRIEMPHLTASLAIGASEVRGALEFLAALDPSTASATVVTHRDGELWADLLGYEVRLGREVEMTEKAVSLEALLAQGVPDGSHVVMIAPTNPAVLTPSAATDEGSEDVAEDGAAGDTGNVGDEDATEDDGESTDDEVGPEDD